MTTGQLELPLFEAFRSTADNPAPEQDRTHPAQIVIQHCGRRGQHAAHARVTFDGTAGCPGVPDIREIGDVEPLLAETKEREAVRNMEVLTYNCGARREYHDPHTRTDGRRCPGLQTRQCTSAGEHPHHRWWVIPDAFYWCNGFSLPRLRGRRVEDVELP